MSSCVAILGLSLLATVSQAEDLPIDPGETAAAPVPEFSAYAIPEDDQTCEPGSALSGCFYEYDSEAPIDAPGRPHSRSGAERAANRRDLRAFKRGEASRLSSGRYGRVFGLEEVDRIFAVVSEQGRLAAIGAPHDIKLAKLDQYYISFWHKVEGNRDRIRWEAVKVLGWLGGSFVRLDTYVKYLDGSSIVGAYCRALPRYSQDCPYTH